MIWLIWVERSAAQAPKQGEAVTVQQFYGLRRDQAVQGWPVRLRCVVLCYDFEWNKFYVRDGTGTAYLNPRSLRTRPEVGQLVELTGQTIVVGGNNDVTNLSLTVIGRVGLPPGNPLTLPQLTSDYGQWIETSGRVRVAEVSSGRLALMVRDQNQSCLVYVLGPPKTNDFKWLLDCNVRLRGINNSTIVNGRLQSASLFVPDFGEITVLDRPVTGPLGGPVVAVQSVLNRELGPWTNAPVHLNGLIVIDQPGQSLILRDPTGTIRAQVSQVTQAPADTRADVWGYLSASPNGPILSDAYFELTPAPARNAVAAPPTEAGARAAPGPGTLTQIADIIRLPRAEASSGAPVRVRGVLTYADAEWHNGFLQGQSGAVYLDLTQKDLHAGQWVEVTGQTGPGGFSPVILKPEIQVLGVTNLPTAARVDLDDLANGHFDSRWVEMEGVVRTLTETAGHLTLGLMTPKGRFKAIVPEFANQAMPTNLLDTVVRIQGACGAELNSRRQLSGITLHVQQLGQVRIVVSAPGDPFAVETTKIAAVATFDPERLAGRRVKVSGIVTLRAPGQGFFLQDISGGMRVQARETNELRLGDVVDVLGFPAMGDFSPYFEEAVYRVTGSGSPPAAKPSAAIQVLEQGTNDNLVVRLDARLLQSVPRSANPELILQDGAIIFTARVEGSAPTGSFPALASGSLVRLTGVCSIQGDQRHDPKTFRLLLRQPTDIELRERPPWWTWQRASWTLGVMVVVLFGAAGWGLTLRRQVQVKSELIRQKLEQEAALEERFRTLVNNANDIVYTHDLAGNMSSLNQAGERFFACPSEQWRKVNVAEILAPGEHDKIRRMIQRKTVEGGRTTYEVNVVAGDGGERTLEVSTWLVQRDGKSVEVQGIARDVTERKRALEEKELLLKEIHHRVKNNMQVVSSLLTLQSGQTKDPNIVALFRQSENRVKSMALIHEKLYKSADLARVDFIEYTSSLIQMISVAHGIGTRAIRTDLDIQPVSLGIDAAIPVGLILNELVSNAFKHAFPAGREGVIGVRLYAEGNQVTLTVRDNGAGLADDFDIEKSPSLGMRLVKILTKQIGGTLVARSQGGAEFTIIFPLTSRKAIT